jgi:hypothetical protein
MRAENERTGTKVREDKAVERASSQTRKYGKQNQPRAPAQSTYVKLQEKMVPRWWGPPQNKAGDPFLAKSHLGQGELCNFEGSRRLGLWDGTSKLRATKVALVINKLLGKLETTRHKGRISNKHNC